MEGVATATAERQLNVPEWQLPRQRSWAAAELPAEERARAQYVTRFLATVGMRASVEVPLLRAGGPTLASTTEAALAGDPEANARADINIATAVSEGSISKDYYSRVVKEIGPGGTIQQFGLTEEQMHLNSVLLRPGRSPLLQQYTFAEGFTGYRHQEYLRDGTLKNGVAVTASLVPDNPELTEEDLGAQGDGFFTRTITLCLQGTTQEGDKIVTESIYRSGTTAAEDAPFFERQAKRIDIKAVGMVYEWLGHKPPRTALEFLQNPIVLNKEEFPNGLLDFARLCDIAMDVLQDKTGERTIDQYYDLMVQSARIDASLAGVRALVKKDLLAAAGTFETPEDAVHLLWELVRVHATFDAVENRELDPGVFGAAAKIRIEKSRTAHDQGDFLLRDQHRLAAVEVSVITGCGGGACGVKDVDKNSDLGKQATAKIKLKSGDKLKVWSGSKCINPECDAEGEDIVYVHDPLDISRGVDKLCTGCGTTEIDGKVTIRKRHP